MSIRIPLPSVCRFCPLWRHGFRSALVDSTAACCLCDWSVTGFSLFWPWIGVMEMILRCRLIVGRFEWLVRIDSCTVVGSRGLRFDWGLQFAKLCVGFGWWFVAALCCGCRFVSGFERVRRFEDLDFCLRRWRRDRLWRCSDWRQLWMYCVIGFLVYGCLVIGDWKLCRETLYILLDSVGWV